MKARTLALLLGCSIVIGICSADTSRFTTVIEAQTLIEDTLNLKDWDPSTLLPYSLIYTNLEKRCSPASISAGKQLAELLQPVWADNIRSRNLQSEMNNRFTLLKSMVVKIPSTDEQLFCKQKYLLYALMELSQKLALGQKVENSQQEPRTSQRNEGWAEEHGSADIQPQVAYLTLMSHNETLATTEDHALAQLAQDTIQAEIGRLLLGGFLNEEDLQRLENKIDLSYIDRCGTTRGSYHMTQKTDGTDRILKQIKLNINLCSDRGYLALFTNYVRQIFMHELAHYLYYFKDSATDGFGNICRKNGVLSCQEEDFVSTYAQKSKEEDYAESFTYWYLKNYAGQSIITDQEHGSASSSLKKETKQAYFDRVYGE